MRTVLLGADFMYDSVGNLKPIEINTNSTLNTNDIVENIEDVFDFSELNTFITNNGFTKVIYIGSITELDSALKTFTDSNFINYTFYNIGGSSLTVPYIDDAEDTLIIRSAYDTTAIIDDTYCADKFNFIKLVGNQDYGIEYALIDDDATLKNTITTIPDNGVHPNFILKSKYPGYDVTIYPKLYKITSQEQLNSVISNYVTNEYFLETFLYNPDKLYNGTHLQVLRYYSLLYPPTLQSIGLGQNTQIPSNAINITPVYNPEGDLKGNFRTSYITSNVQFGGYPKLRSTDRIAMADGTWKAPNEIQVGDLVKSLIIPDPTGANDDGGETPDFHIDLNTFNSGVQFTNSTVNNVSYINRLEKLVTITFTDGNTWNDSAVVSLLTLSNNDVKFKLISELAAGDQLIDVDVNNLSTPFLNLKTVQSVQIVREFFDGWVMGITDSHLYVVKDTTTNNSFALFEHNTSCVACGTGRTVQCGLCPSKLLPACFQTTAPSAICVSQT